MGTEHVSSANDYNSTCVFTNKFAYRLVKVTSHLDIGKKWNHTVPDVVAPGETVTIEMQASSATVTGTKGSWSFYLDAPYLGSQRIYVNGFMNCSYYSKHGRWADMWLSSPIAAGQNLGYYQIDGQSADHNQSNPLKVTSKCFYGTISIPTPLVPFAIRTLQMNNEKTVINSKHEKLLGQTTFYQDGEQFIDKTVPKGSLRPIVQLLTTTPKVPINVVAAIRSSALQYVPWTLEIWDNETRTRMWTSDMQCSSDLNYKTLLAKFTNDTGFPAIFYRYAADLLVEVKIAITNQSIPFIGSKPFIEIYGILPESDRAKSVYSDGIPLIFLRDCWPPGYNATFLTSDTGAITQCSKQLFANWLKYNTEDGAPTLTTSAIGSTFDMPKYMKKMTSIANCYDYAAMIDLSLHLIGLTAAHKWLYMRPFGFIKPTVLKGFPGAKCNNPFFNEEPSLMVLPYDDSRRTMFGNHAMIESSTDEGKTYQVVDITSGPNTGTLTRSQYVVASIDPSPETLYTEYSPPKNKPGTVKDIHTNPDWGVTDLNSAVAVPIARLRAAASLRNDHNKLDHILERTSSQPQPAVQGTTFSWSEVDGYLEEKVPGLVLKDSVFTVGKSATSSTMLFTRPTVDVKDIVLDVKVYASHLEAQYSFAAYLSAFDDAYEKIVEPVPSGYGQHAVAKANGSGDDYLGTGLFAWVDGVSFISVTGGTPALAAQIADAIQAGLAQEHTSLEEMQRSFRDKQVDIQIPSDLRVEEEFQVNFSNLEGVDLFNVTVAKDAADSIVVARVDPLLLNATIKGVKPGTFVVNFDFAESAGWTVKRVQREVNIRPRN